MRRHVKTGRGLTVAMLMGMALLASAFILPSEARANPQGGHSRHWEGTSDFAGRILHGLLRKREALNLSEEQAGKIKTMVMDYAKTRIRGEAEVKLAEVDIRALVFDEKSDLPAIESAMKKSESARTAVRIERVKALRAAAAVLTPEQREKWRASMRDTHREGRHGSSRHAGEYGDHDMPKQDG